MRMNFAMSATFFCVLSCALFLWLPENTIIREGDAKGYYKSAKLFAEKNRLKLKSGLLPVATGYPLLLGTLFKFFGKHAFLVVFLNLLFSIICLASMYRTARSEFGDGPAQWILWMFPLHVGFLLYTQCALTEVVLATLYMLFVEYMLLFLRSKKNNSLRWAAVWLGISLAIKPAAWIFGIFLSTALFIAFLMQQVAFAQVITFTTIFFGLIFLSLLFNWSHFGVFGFPKIMVRNLNHLYLLKIYKIVYGVSEKEGLKALYAFSKQSDRWPLLFKLLREHPLVCVRIWIFNVVKTFCGFFSYHFALIANHNAKLGGSIFSFEGSLLAKGYRYLFGISKNLLLQFLAVLELCFMIVRPIALLVSLYKWLEQKRYDVFLFVISYLGYFLFITGPDGCARLRMMVEPLLFTVTLAGVYQVYRIIQKKTGREYEYECA